MQETVFTNARLVLEHEVMQGSVLLRGGRIADISAGASTAPGRIDCDGDFLCPGLVELHTDNLEKHLEPRPGVHWPVAAAIIAHDAELAGAGVTTVFDALRVGSIPSDPAAGYDAYARRVCTEIDLVRREGGFRIDHRIHLRAEICSETLSDELDEFSERDGIGLVSLMDHAPGQRQFVDLAQFRKYLSGKRGMSAAEIDEHFALLLSVKERFGAAHETAAIACARRLGAMLASHDDTTPEHVARSSEIGVGIAEFPTTRAAAEACGGAGIAVMMGAPNLLRGGSHSGNVAAQDLLEIGRLDILSSDYAPSSLLMGAVRAGEMLGDMSKGLAMATSAPAQAAGLRDRGALALGRRADLLRFAILRETPLTKGVWSDGRRVA